MKILYSIVYDSTLSMHVVLLLGGLPKKLYALGLYLRAFQQLINIDVL